MGGSPRVHATADVCFWPVADLVSNSKSGQLGPVPAINPTGMRIRLNETTWTYALGNTKTSASGVRREKPLRGEVVVALQAWLDVAKLTEGPLFRRLYRGGATGADLSRDQVARIVQRRAQLAGLAGD